MTARERRDRAAELRNIVTPLSIAAVELTETIERLVRFADQLARDDTDEPKGGAPCTT